MEDGAHVVIVGGGVAGAFLSLELLQGARCLGREVRVTIIEKKPLRRALLGTEKVYYHEGCNNCAGGLSPRLVDAFEELNLRLPAPVIRSTVRTLTVHATWKNLELSIPPGRRMYTVYRGSRPACRAKRYVNFDSFLLNEARRQGAEVLPGRAVAFERGPAGTIQVKFVPQEGEEQQTLRADFLAVAWGVNSCPPHSGRILRSVLPAWRPPRVRRALLFEVQLPEAFEDFLHSEVYFIEYGSRSVRVELSSILPKGRFMTVSLLGPSVDALGFGLGGGKPGLDGQWAVIEGFLALPHIRRILPPCRLTVACACKALMTVGMARGAVADRVAVIGDAAVARLYKDGIISARLTAGALARCLLWHGVKYETLRRHYLPSLYAIDRDNHYGKAVFAINRHVFRNAVLSRIVYQAFVTERKHVLERRRQLDRVVWKIGSGDSSYREILISMFRPHVVWSILTGGLCVTIRNWITERIFGLRWRNIGRFPTAVPLEDFRERRFRILAVTDTDRLLRSYDVEKMYSIRIKADPSSILRCLGALGEAGGGFFRPRWISIRRLSGQPNQERCVLHYHIPIPFLSFRLVLERRMGQQGLLYRIRGGFGDGGLLVFLIDKERPQSCLLTIFVAFNVPSAKHLLARVAWRTFARFFPWFVHDVFWNHGLCSLKELAEEHHRRMSSEAAGAEARTAP